ncbi:TetR/AcrR family transcriptional regulator [Streptococcus sp. H31]|uniref:TetR/AcrR family transcriptional regulator n=1 Tax=Streptococcus huangxiaojuni TaxID=3237239 RepID=UPI0034A1F5CD
MPAGRPSKQTNKKNKDSRSYLVAAALELIKKGEPLNVRTVCSRSGLSTGTFYYYFQDKDDLLGYCLTQSLTSRPVEFCNELPLSQQIFTVYLPLLQQYQDLGKPVMRQFYTGSNSSLARYMGETKGQFLEGTVMFDSQKLIKKAIQTGMLSETTDSYKLSADICILIKGSVFDWCLSDYKDKLIPTAKRLLENYLAAFSSQSV